MANEFQNSPIQASLEGLKSQLSQMDVQIVERIDTAFRQLQEAQRTQVARGRETGGSRSTATALPELKAEQEAVDAQVVSYKELNELIAQRIKLETQAASAAKKTADATNSTSADASVASRTRASRTAVAAETGAGSGTSVEMWLAEQRAAQAAAQQRAESESHRMGQRSRWTTTSPEAQSTASAISSVKTEALARANTQLAAAEAAALAPSRQMAETLSQTAEAEERAAQAARNEVEALAQMANEQRQAAMAAEQLAAGEDLARAAIQRAAMAMDEYDDSLMRSGALSSSAIQAMAKGTITARELGNQVVETIGKFGLWAGAAGALYGTLGLLDEIKDGAVGVSSSVTALGRFLPASTYNPGQARQEIVQQGKETATPLDQVGDTAQQFSKVLKNQGDVFTATHVALTAAKLDNISLANSYEYLTAIMQESGVSASKLPGIFDQITAAQDKVGARVSVMLPAVAGAIGAVQGAGGNASQLIGLQALTSIRTGFQGATIANMFRQGAGNYYNQASERGIRSRFGINPNEGFTQALIQAIQKSPSLTNVERQTLAGGFFGTRYGPRAAPLFRSSNKELDEALDQTKAGKYPGFANKQLGNAMSQTNNQLAMLKVNLQAIGAELTGSNLTSPFGALLSVINGILQATGDLIHAWDELPGPVKEFGSDLALVAGSIAMIRKFNLGSMMAGNNPVTSKVSSYLSRSPEKTLEMNATEYMGNLSGAIKSQLQSALSRQMSSSLELAAAQNEMAVLTEQGEAGSKAYQAAQARAAAAFTSMKGAESDVAAYAGLGDKESLAKFKAGYMANPEAQAKAGLGGSGAAGGAAAGALTGDSAKVEAALTGQASAETGVTAALDRQTAATTRVIATTEEQAIAEEELSMEIAGTSTAMTLLMSGVEMAGAALSFMASNAIPLAIGAFVAFDAAKASLAATKQNEDSGLKRALNSTTAAGAMAGANQYMHGQVMHLPLIGSIGLPEVGGGDMAAGMALYRQQIGKFKAEQEGMSASDTLLGGTVNPDERAGNWKAAYKAFQGDKSLQAQDPGQYSKTSSYLYKKVEGADVTGGKGSNPFEMWEQAGQSLQNQLEPMMQSMGDAAKVFGTTQGTMKSLAMGYMYTVEKFGNNPSDTQAFQILAQAQSDLVNALEKQVEDIQGLAEGATSNKGQTGDYQQGLSDVSKALTQAKSAMSLADKLPGANGVKERDALTELMGQYYTKRQSLISGLLGNLSAQGDVSVAAVQGVGPAADLQRAQVQLQSYESQLSSAKKMGADATTVDELLAKVGQQSVTVLQDRISYYQQLSQALTSYQQGATANPVAQEQIAVSQLSALYSKLVASGDTDQTQLLSILGQKRAAIMQGISDQISNEQSQAQSSLSQSDIGQPQQVQLANAVGSAQKQLAYIQSLPKNEVNPQTLYSAWNNLYQAQGAMAQFIIQQGQSMIAAEGALAEGETFSPTQMAADALKYAKELLAYDKAHNQPAATIKSDMAGVAAAMKANTEAGWQEQESTIEFLASTYQITGATEIQRLQKLEKTMKKAHASYQDIQQVAQEIWNLEYGNTGDLNLNTGSMHLPSTYEVKSAIMGGKNANRRTTTAGLLADVQTHVNLIVNVNKGGDTRKVIDAIQTGLGTSVNGLMQAAGN